MSLNDDINNLPNTPQEVMPGHLNHHATIHSALKNSTYIISAGNSHIHAGKVVRLNENGKLHIGSASVTASTDPANKEYVDQQIGGRAPREHTHRGSDIVSQTTEYVSYSDDRFANHLLKLNADGKFRITTSGITAPNDPVNKQYVDTAISEGSAGSGQTMWWN